MMKIIHFCDKTIAEKKIEISNCEHISRSGMNNQKFDKIEKL